MQFGLLWRLVSLWNGAGAVHSIPQGDYISQSTFGKYTVSICHARRLHQLLPVVSRPVVALLSVAAWLKQCTFTAASTSNSWSFMPATPQPPCVGCPENVLRVAKNEPCSDASDGGTRLIHWSFRVMRSLVHNEVILMYVTAPEVDLSRHIRDECTYSSAITCSGWLITTGRQIKRVGWFPQNSFSPAIF
jgi:hypothetical protein